MDHVDIILRDSLINWALEDFNNPLRNQTLMNLGKTNWVDFLYGEEESHLIFTNEDENLYNSKDKAEKHRQEDDEEEWKKELLKAIYIDLKIAFGYKFNTIKWGMKKINTTGMYKLGPMNKGNEIFFKFKIGIKNGIVFWDMENHLGKIRPKGFESTPKIIAKTVENKGHDFLVRKNSKSFSRMENVGIKSGALYILLLALKEQNIKIGNDAHGNMWIFDDRKKKAFSLVPDTNESIIKWLIVDKESGLTLDEIESLDDVKRVIIELKLPKVMKY